MLMPVQMLRGVVPAILDFTMITLEHHHLAAKHDTETVKLALIQMRPLD